jgi:hypothetical protein
MNYRLFFLDRNGAVEARDEFEADSDGAALLIAAQLFDACSEPYADYELWAGARRLASPGPDGPPAASLDDDEMARSVEMVVVERERVLLDSRWAVARSQRLLEHTNKLLADLQARRAGRHS